MATLAQWLKGDAHAGQERLLLSLREGSAPLRGRASGAMGNSAAAVFLSGPEGGLSAAEEDAAMAAGFVPVSLGQRVLRAETAALAALTLLAD
jgi:16S rRNA (uracil1498-N3)-methyltransferase